MRLKSISFETWDRYSTWSAHVPGATALLQVRGKAQFERERGGLLYIQIRSQIVGTLSWWCIHFDD